MCPKAHFWLPLAFALYINDLPQNLSSDCLLYADDQKLYRKIKTPSDARLLQEDLDRLQEWCITWGLTLNPSKCKAFTMTLRRKPVQTTYKIGTSALESVTSIRDLGITIDSKLTFSDHLNKTVSQANRALGLLIRSFQTGYKGAKFETKSLFTATMPMFDPSWSTVRLSGQGGQIPTPCASIGFSTNSSCGLTVTATSPVNPSATPPYPSTSAFLSFLPEGFNTTCSF